MSLTVGTHNCIVLKTFNGWFAESGQNNTPSIRLNLRVTDGDSDGEEIEWHGWLTEKGAARTIETLQKVFGWDGDLEKLATQINTGPFAEKRCRIVTEEETYEGKTKVKIKWLNAAGSPGMSPERAMEIARRLSGKTSSAAPAPRQQPPMARGLPKPPRDPDLDPDSGPPF